MRYQPQSDSPGTVGGHVVVRVVNGKSLVDQDKPLN